MQATQLADIKSVIPDVILDIRYATTNNFTGKKLYKYPRAELIPEALDQLSKAAASLRDHGYRVVIYDAYRSPVVQDHLREVCSDSNYVAEISNHCRGITVDISLATTEGKYLDMGTDHDDFSPKAHSNTTLITAEQQANRDVLCDALEAVGFYQHAYEWWHFDYKPNHEWPVIDSADNVV